jgi:hypothetical protein
VQQAMEGGRVKGATWEQIEEQRKDVVNVPELVAAAVGTTHVVIASCPALHFDAVAAAIQGNRNIHESFARSDDVNNLWTPEPDRRSNAGSAASEDSLRRAKRRIASCRSVLKMNIYDYPEDSEKREKFKRDFTREMATALAYLAVQKLDPDGVKQVKMLVEDVQA